MKTSKEPYPFLIAKRVNEEGFFENGNENSIMVDEFAIERLSNVLYKKINNSDIENMN